MDQLQVRGPLYWTEANYCFCFNTALVINNCARSSEWKKKQRLWVFQNVPLIETGIKIGFLYDSGCEVHNSYGFLLQALSATKRNTKKQKKKSNKPKDV